jgi:hypothetical protein
MLAGKMGHDLASMTAVQRDNAWAWKRVGKKA